jgi:hypothetical protein
MAGLATALRAVYLPVDRCLALRRRWLGSALAGMLLHYHGGFGVGRGLSRMLAPSIKWVDLLVLKSWRRRLASGSPTEPSLTLSPIITSYASQISCIGRYRRMGCHPAMLAVTPDEMEALRDVCVRICCERLSGPFCKT